jgi:hypothetical protein
MKNKQALKLPDPLLVRYYREDRIDLITRVTRLRGGDIEVTLSSGAVEHWQHLKDLGWVPKPD